MRIIPLLAAAALSLSIASVVTPASAAPAVPNISTADASAVVQARHHGRHFRHHVWRGHGIYGHRWGGGGWNQCRAWRHECANRWPGLGWRYQRCLRNHGC